LAEREIIRLLIRYGAETLIEQNEETGEVAVTVADYLIHELRSDELDMQQPLLRRIFEECEQLSASGSPVADTYFIRHPDPEISRLVADLIEPKYVLSNIHRRNGATVKTEENNLHEVVPISVLAYKNKRVVMFLRAIATAMMQAETDKDGERMETLQSQYAALTQVKKELGHALGKRILT
jgi:DNA primase